jgi:hypothetical protein
VLPKTPRGTVCFLAVLPVLMVAVVVFSLLVGH